MEARGASKLHQLFIGRVGGTVQDRAVDLILSIAAAYRVSRLSLMTQLPFFFFFFTCLLSLPASPAIMSPPPHREQCTGYYVLA